MMGKSFVIKIFLEKVVEMKKSVLEKVGLLILVLCVCLFNTNEIVAQKKVQLQFGTGGLTGSWYAGGAKMAEIFNREYPEYNLTCLVGGGESNLKNIAQGKFEFGYSYQDMMMQAYNRIGTFSEDYDYENIRSVMSLVPMPMQVLVWAKSDIYTFKDLIGKRVSGGYQGSGAEVSFRDFLSVIGITPEIIEAAGGAYIYANYVDAVNMLKDGLLDVFATMGAMPLSFYMELAAERAIRILEFDDESIEKFFAKYDGWEEYTIAAGTYNIKEPVRVITGLAGIATNINVPEELVYKFTKAVYEGRDELAEVHESLSEVEDLAAKGFVAPIHPGAEKYWKEIGLLK